MRWLRHRQRAQITPLLLMTMVVMVGAVALVVDAGIFFVTGRQLQSAADAAALTASWYEDSVDGTTPLCDFPNPPPPSAQCDHMATHSYPVSTIHPCYFDSDCAANAVAERNIGFIGQLCRNITFNPASTGPGNPGRVLSIANPPGNPIVATNFYVMTISCDAPYWFARIFPNIPATMTISATATANVGYLSPVGVTTDITQAVGHPGHETLASRLRL